MTPLIFSQMFPGCHCFICADPCKRGAAMEEEGCKCLFENLTSFLVECQYVSAHSDISESGHHVAELCQNLARFGDEPNVRRGNDLKTPKYAGGRE